MIGRGDGVDRTPPGAVIFHGMQSRYRIYLKLIPLLPLIGLPAGEVPIQCLGCTIQFAWRERTFEWPDQDDEPLTFHHLAGLVSVWTTQAPPPRPVTGNDGAVGTDWADAVVTRAGVIV
jgi:hypothetical protein